MIFKNVLDDLNISGDDYFYLLALTVSSILITYSMINLNESIGIYCSDVFVYLSNALFFAGFESSRTYLYLSPLICFLTSVLFRLGFLSEISLYIVTGAFGIIGNLGLYVFLKNRFGSLLSLCGAILFSSFSLNLLWWANGTLDISAVALSIWVMVFLVLAVDKDSRYYLIALPLFVFAVFTRYTALFLLPLILLYYLSAHDFFSNLELLLFNSSEFSKKMKAYLKGEEFRHILESCGLAFLFLLLFSTVILAGGSHLSFMTQGSTFASGSKGETIDNAYTTDTFFYLHEFPNFLYADAVTFDGPIPVLIGSNLMSYVLIGLFALGIALSFYRLFKFYSRSDLGNKSDCTFLSRSCSDNKSLYKYFKYFAVSLFILLLVLSILSFRINSIITISLLFVDFIILFSALRKRGVDREEYSLNALVLSLFLVYFIFFTFLNIKVNRYIITVLPAFVYFTVFALDGILDWAEGYDFPKLKGMNLLNIVPIVLIAFCIVSAFAFPSIVHGGENFNGDKVIADYLIDYDSSYADKEIAVYNQRSLNWYLKEDAIALTDEQLDYLEASNITYYISDGNFKLENYTVVHNENGLYLYERID